MGQFRIALNEMSVQAHFHYSFLATMLDYVVLKIREEYGLSESEAYWNEVKLDEFRTKVKRENYECIVLDTFPVVEVEDWVYYTSSTLREFYRNGGVVVGIAEGAILATKLDMDYYRVVPPSTEWQVSIGDFAPKVKGAELEPIQCYAEFVTLLPVTYADTYVARIVTNTGEGYLVTYESMLHDLVIAFPDPPNGAEVLATFKAPYRLRNMPAAVRYNNMLLLGFHPEGDKKLTTLFYEWLKPLIEKYV